MFFVSTSGFHIFKSSPLRVINGCIQMENWVVVVHPCKWSYYTLHVFGAHESWLVSLFEENTHVS